MSRNSIFSISVVLMALVIGTTSLAKPPEDDRKEPTLPGLPELSPSPLTVDVATHNQGNILTTIDNHGYIGGRVYYNLPSGEFPRNSGHDYIGEIMYWMGATSAGGDTLVANTWDEFQAIPSLISGTSEHSILLSTDTTLYYDYQVDDTTGAGIGNPSHGWKVWNADSSDYVYRQNYDPNSTEFYPGGPLALQESHYRFNDAAGGTSLMGLEITHSGLQWNYCYNEDFIFFLLEITNTSAVDYTDFAFGLYIDIDVGGPDGTGENGRLGDLVAVDSANNLAWIYDSLGFDPGWRSRTGVMGTKLLETPDDIGVTGFRTGDFFLAPDTDPGRYAFIDSTGFDSSLPPTDQYYIQCVRGINLTAGKTVKVVWALIAGDNESDFRDNAQRAQQFYDDYYVGAQPPITPTLTAQAGDKVIYLSWNDTAQTSVDPRSGEEDFVGYKLYRSDDWGVTWGIEDRDNDNLCMDIDYLTVAQYAVADPADPIQHSYVDQSVYNDREYWYCLVAYDGGDSAAGVDVLQSGFGVAGFSSNVVAVTPRNDAAGLVTAEGSVTHSTTGEVKASDGEVYPIIFDQLSLVPGEYEVSFVDTDAQTTWSLYHVDSNVIVLANQDRFTGDAGLYEVTDGLRVVVREGEAIPRSMGQTTFGGADTTLTVLEAKFYGPIMEWGYGLKFGNAHTRSTYEFRYTTDSTLASPFNVMGVLNYKIPFEIWNIETNTRVMASLYDLETDGDWDAYDPIIVVNYAYDDATDPYDVAWPTNFSWMFAFDPDTYAPEAGDIYTVEGAPLNGPNDVFSFQTDQVSSSLAASAMGNIAVVPNPYFARYSAEVETGGAEDAFLKFRDVPDVCTIRIYTLAGDLVTTLRNDDGDGVVSWDLLSSNRQRIASGIYLYHVESPYGEHLGRFAVIK